MVMWALAVKHRAGLFALLAGVTLLNQLRFLPENCAAVDLPIHTLPVTVDLPVVREPPTTTRREQQKPLLILHVGPTKTGSTTIQMGLPKEALATDAGLRVLQIGPYGASCLKTAACNETEWLAELASYRASDTPILLTDEGLASIDVNNPNVQKVAKDLSEHYRVRIVVVYRPFFSWLPSAYAQEYKVATYRSKGGRWQTIDWSQTQQGYVVPSFVDWTRDRLKDLQRDSASSATSPCDSWGAYRRLQQLFPTADLRVLDMYQEGKMLHNFLDVALPDVAGNATRDYLNHRKRRNKNPVVNPSDGFVAVYAADQIVAAAYERLQGVVRRNVARDALVPLVNDDLPLQCLSTTEQDIVWQRTVQAHEALGMGGNRTALEESFRKAVGTKLCSVDAVAALERPEIQRVLEDLIQQANQKKK